MGIIKPHKPHVFVVMPFGAQDVPGAEPGASTRSVDFDKVYELLLQPALQQAGCEPFRADQEPGAGDIRTDMFFELVTADFVLTDISILNPNVFYELGVRQGVAPRGLLMVHGGHSKRPFNIAPDRTFGYDGSLFVQPIAEAKLAAIASAKSALARVIKAAIEVDPQGQSSPIYKELPGLKAPDPRDIKSAKARYFDAAFEQIADRVAIARKRGLPGDILTLADEAPNRLYRARLLHQAGRSLFDLQHFQLCLELLTEALALNPNDADAESLIGMALNRIGRREEAEARIKSLVSRVQAHNDGQGALGRVYKDRWRSMWETQATLEGRRQAARNFSELAEQAIESYASALRCDQRSYYNGINALGLAKLLEHVGQPTRLSSAMTAASQLVSIVARHKLEDTQNAKDDATRSEHTWAVATCGELALLSGDAQAAEQLFTRAATTPGVTPFALESMLRQLEMYEGLGLHPEATAGARRALELGRQYLPKVPTPPRHVLLASGHMIDADDRPKPRFPRGKEQAVAARIAECLDAWQIGKDDLAICGAARGTDLMVAEACLARGCPVTLLIAKEEGEYLAESVELPRSNWSDRYFAVKENPLTTVRFQPEDLGTTPKDLAHARNNRWCLNTAWATARVRASVFVLLVWDQQPTGDGPGGTSHAASIAKQYAGKLEIIDPTQLLG